MAGSYPPPEIGEKNTTGDAKYIAAIKRFNELLDAENLIPKTSLSASSKPVTWYTPKIIATEQTRESTSFGTLTTADEIKEVVLPESGLLAIGYTALVKSSVSGAGRIAIFLGNNQLKLAFTGGAPSVQESSTAGIAFNTVSTVAGGLSKAEEATSFVTTGQSLAVTSGAGGLTYIFAAAGTYNISLQFKATSGNVTAKERKLWVTVLGN